MNKLEQIFNIHPVGQGFFYSCEINIDSVTKFRMVFDCGSVTKYACLPEVNHFRNSGLINDKILDLLVISHFDSDHVNNIGQLLKDKIKVKKLVMPFLTFEERLFLLLKEFKNVENDSLDDFSKRFILNPLQALSENLDDDSEIYFIESDPNKPITPDVENEIDPIPKEQERFLFDFDSSSKTEINEKDRTILNVSRNNEIFKILDSNKGILSAPGEVNKLMEFLFYKQSV